MPTKLGNPYSPLWRGSYPHMLKEDWPVWDLYLQRNAAQFQRIYYDVCVGGVWAEGPNVTEADQKMFFQNTAKRIDALGEMEKELWLIEVASRPGLRAVGQLQTYVALWLADPQIHKPFKAVLVCNSIDADLQKAIEFYGMLVRYVV